MIKGLICCLVFLLSTNSILAKELINGILIEGIDYSGKTVVAELLAKKLKERKFNIKMGHGELATSELNRFLMKEGFKILDRNIPSGFPDSRFIEPLVKMQVASLAIDSMYAQAAVKRLNEQKAFLIQDRYVLTLQCLQRFFTPNLKVREQEIIENNDILFKHNIYLTCAPEILNKRMEGSMHTKPPKTIERYYLSNLDKLNSYNALCQSIIKDDPSWLIIDTSNMTVEQVVDRILKFMGIK